MKKFIIILAATFTVFACTSDSPEDANGLCLKPISLEANNVTNTTATLNWSSAVETSEFEVEYGTSGFNQGSGISAIVEQSSHNISDLAPSTPYEFYVNLFCPETLSYSVWAGPFEFSTLNTNPICADPTDFIVRTNNTAIGSDYIKLRWENSDNDGSQLQYGEQGFSLGTGTIQSEGDNIDNGFGEIVNLNSSTTYDIYVRNNCQENGFSTWVGPLTATTL